MIEPRCKVRKRPVTARSAETGDETNSIRREETRTCEVANSARCRARISRKRVTSLGPRSRAQRNAQSLSGACTEPPMNIVATRHPSLPQDPHNKSRTTPNPVTSRRARGKTYHSTGEQVIKSEQGSHNQCAGKALQQKRIGTPRPEKRGSWRYLRSRSGKAGDPLLMRQRMRSLQEQALTVRESPYKRGDSQRVSLT